MNTKFSVKYDFISEILIAAHHNKKWGVLKWHFDWSRVRKRQWLTYFCFITFNCEITFFFFCFPDASVLWEIPSNVATLRISAAIEVMASFRPLMEVDPFSFTFPISRVNTFHCQVMKFATVYVPFHRNSRRHKQSTSKLRTFLRRNTRDGMAATAELIKLCTMENYFVFFCFWKVLRAICESNF